MFLTSISVVFLISLTLISSTNDNSQSVCCLNINVYSVKVVTSGDDMNDE